MRVWRRARPAARRASSPGSAQKATFPFPYVCRTLETCPAPLRAHYIDRQSARHLAQPAQRRGGNACVPAYAAQRTAFWHLRALACRRRRGEVMAFTSAPCRTSWLAAPCSREFPNAAAHAADGAATTAVLRRAAHPRRLPAAAARRTSSAVEVARTLVPRSTHAPPHMHCRTGAVMLAAALTNGEAADLEPPPEDPEPGGHAALGRSCTRTYRRGRRRRRRRLR